MGGTSPCLPCVGVDLDGPILIEFAPVGPVGRVASSPPLLFVAVENPKEPNRCSSSILSGLASLAAPPSHMALLVDLGFRFLDPLPH